jgi:glycosyltransferase involved in cell wall biosynthesis
MQNKISITKSITYFTIVNRMILDRTPQLPPEISPLAADCERPLWSVMIPTYNCSAYLKETLESVLKQAPEELEMQIEVVDDCSTDADVESLVKEIGKGRIGFFSQKQNVGSLRNFETCINRSTGKLVHLLHGDDKVKPGFYSKIEDLFKKYPSAGAAFSGFSIMDENGIEMLESDLIQGNEGIIEDWLAQIARKQLLQACSIVVKRSVYEQLGGFYKVHFGEDWEMWTRIAAHYAVAYSPENLADYRIHNNNITSRYLSSAQNIKDIESVIDIIQNYLPENNRKEIKDIAKRNFSISFTQNAQVINKKKGYSKVAVKQAQAALRLHFNKTTLTSLLKLYLKIILGYRGRN